jgi:protein-L-isoaspartate(D-aspartate) O-methyltransferase
VSIRGRGSRAALGLLWLAACEARPLPPADQEPAAPAGARPTTGSEGGESARTRELRAQMVSEQIEARGVHDSRVLAAMRAVPRHRFVPEAQQRYAYADSPLPIEDDQTISQPYIVALMTELAQVKPGDRVLEVGTGSGYQAAVLAQMGARVYSIEIVEGLARSARKRLAELGYAVEVRHGDGYAGWPEHAPFDAILITAAPPAIPKPLEQQLAPNGRLVAPVGDGEQDLVVLTRTERGFERRSVIPVRFVPMTGKAQDGR